MGLSLQDASEPQETIDLSVGDVLVAVEAHLLHVELVVLLDLEHQIYAALHRCLGRGHLGIEIPLFLVQGHYAVHTGFEGLRVQDIELFHADGFQDLLCLDLLVAAHVQGDYHGVFLHGEFQHLFVVGRIAGLEIAHGIDLFDVLAHGLLGKYAARKGLYPEADCIHADP